MNRPYSRVATELPTIPRVFLTSNDADVSEPRLREVATFATGIAPEKTVIARHPEMVKAAHALHLTVTSWTFKADEKTPFPTVRDEMTHFLMPRSASTRCSQTTPISFHAAERSAGQFHRIYLYS